MQRTETAGPRQREDSAGEAREGEATKAPPKQIYLRSVYPLNPGIPHFVDVPGGW